MTWPTLRDPLHTLPGDYWDPSLESWGMAWSGYAVTHHPGQLWQTNAFHSEHWAFAFSDTLLGYLPAGLIGSGPVAAVLRYNVIFCLVFALAFFGAYVLARQLGARISGALVAGAAFAYAPWRWDQVNHLHVLSTGGIALSLAMLARGHGYSLRGRGPERPGWALAGWLVAAWQITLGFGVGLPFGYAIGILVVVALVHWWRRRPRYTGKLLRFDLIGGTVFLAVTALMAYPYLKMISIYPYGRRGYDDIRFYSPAVQGFFTAPPTDRVWGSVQEPMRAWLLRGRGGWEAVLLPGFVLYGLAAVGLVRSVWSWRQRAIGLAAVLAVGFLAMGMRAPTTIPYRVLHTILPGWDAIRTPGRLIIWVTLLLALLAAGAVTAWPARPARRWLLVLPCLLVLAEGLQSVPTPVVPRSPVSFADLRGPVWVLPSNYKDDELTMLWSTDGFVPLENGSSGLLPAGLVQTRDATRNFPDSASVARLRGLGVHTVLVLRDPNGAKLPIHLQGAAPPPNALTAPLDGLGITRRILPEAIVFDLG